MSYTVSSPKGISQLQSIHREAVVKRRKLEGFHWFFLLLKHDVKAVVLGFADAEEVRRSRKAALFLHKFCKIESQKKPGGRRSYEPDFKAEILRVLISCKKVSEISETFGIAENVGRHPGAISLENFIYDR